MTSDQALLPDSPLATAALRVFTKTKIDLATAASVRSETPTAQQ